MDRRHLGERVNGLCPTQTLCVGSEGEVEREQ